MFCDIIRKYSNTRSSTYKLHIKQQASIDKLKNNVINDFLNIVNKNYFLYKDHSSQFKLYKKDILSLVKRINDNSIDMIITSPPYGDNATTVTYGQYSSLILHWIDTKDLCLEGWELENFSSIDSNSLDGTKKHQNLQTEDFNLIKPFLDSINISKRKKVVNFFQIIFML